MFQHRIARGIGMDRTRIASTARTLPAPDTRAHFGACPRMDSDLVAVDRMHGLVAVSVEDDHWHRLSWKVPPQAPGHRPTGPCERGRWRSPARDRPSTPC